MAMTTEERKVYMHNYYLDNLDYLKRYRKRWYAKNKDIVNERRRARYRKDSSFREYEIERHRAK